MKNNNNNKKRKPSITPVNKKTTKVLSKTKKLDKDFNINEVLDEIDNITVGDLAHALAQELNKVNEGKYVFITEGRTLSRVLEVFKLLLLEVKNFIFKG